MNDERDPRRALVDAWHSYRDQVRAHLEAIDGGTDVYGHLLAIERLARAMRAERWDGWMARRQAAREARP